MSADFSLTSPEPLTGKRDPNVLPALPGRDMAMVAMTAWLDAQHGALDMDDLNAAFVAIGERIDRGDAWLEANGKEHPRYLDAITLRNELENQRRSLLVQIRCAAYACWVHCCELYACLCHIDADAWIRSNARGRFSGQTPQGIWHALRGKQPPPGAWPPEHQELWIERRINQIEVWNMDAMRDRLVDRQLELEDR